MEERERGGRGSPRDERFCCYLWASPATALGLLAAGLALATRGRVRVVRGVLEVEGGLVSWFLHRSASLCRWWRGR